MPLDTPHEIRSESEVVWFFALYCGGRIMRALRATFARLQQIGNMGNRTEVTFSIGSAAKLINKFQPDLAFFDPNDTDPNGRINRLPGEIKPSWKWHTGMINSIDDDDRSDFRQVLAQINWYMKQHRTRYGYVLTDRELVAIRRLNNSGDLELSQPIRWTTAGNVHQQNLTLLLALWELGLLASEDGLNGWRL